MKKTLSIIMSAVLAMSGAAAMNSSATLIMGTEGSEQYNSMIEDYNESLISLPELVDDFNVIFPGSNIKNVWVSKNHPSTSQWSSYVIETAWLDTFSFDIMLEDREAILEELSANLGYEDKFEILGEKYLSQPDLYGQSLVNGRDDRITLRFYGDDHELNYMIAEKAYSLVKDKYKIDNIGILLARRQFHNTTVQSCFSSIDDHISYRDELVYEKLKKEIYDSVDQEMLKEKYKATLTETGKLEFSEGFTEADKVKCFRYFAENYNTGIYAMTEAADQSASFMDADLTSGEINYLEGDANCDGQLTIADAAAILQALGNSDKYGLSKQGIFNADLAGDGLTIRDAIEIQRHITGEKDKLSQKN